MAYMCLAIGLIYQHQYPKGVHEQIIGQNPRNENGNRRYKTHQFLTKDIGITALDMFKAQMVAIMDISPIGNYAQFRKNMNKVFGSTIQLELPLFDDELLLNEETWSSHTSSTSNGSKSSLPTQKTDSLKQGVSQQKQNVVLPISGKC